MKNHISHNIKYLCEQEKLTQNEFGQRIDVGRSVVGQWITERTLPKIDAIQRIGVEFNLSLDDFINKRLDDVERGINAFQEDSATYGNPILQDLLKSKDQQIKDKTLIIKMLEDEVTRLRGDVPSSKSRTA
ncbi:helix-turn-helix transcriptional regulator [Cochleicola gelatinilyticus]|uniref:HTH cro/C1-type domain-containing protein n=1 Tax=Cochleicola gelatinilyticus TaxID=1763537 RepID=A0A167IJT8_9FLAO|nr:helix-turn-helix transcriptional regulator [Cochleicola gelatinilyticus]OAB79727.1 hypothetical protein ULVI_03000 [Cochleicola gelatinilyticus]